MHGTRVTRGRAAASLALALLPIGAIGRSTLGSEPPGAAVPAPTRAGGSVTVDDATANAFGFPAPGFDANERRAFAVGNSFFKQNWVTAPSSTSGRDGLGPLFNARSCSGCHVKDGRSRPPEADEPNREGLLLRIGLRAHGRADLPHPAYGDQIQDSSVLGVEPEARVTIRWTREAGSYGDGTAFELVRPSYELRELAYGQLGDGAVLGARVAPHLVGLGLLEAIPESAIVAHADPDDRNADGISGRAHFVKDVPDGAPRLGRFGWKATQPDVREQTAAAFVSDMGITNSLRADEALTDTQRARVRFDSGGRPEIANDSFERVVFYTRALAVPAQRDSADARVIRGRELFEGLGCSACHVSHFVTGSDAFHPVYRAQSIAPYTDLLLHDMGAGLADSKRDGDAAPAEWRTPPLWGLGLVPVVNGHSRYLHDGRARDLTEAVLWHGGEASAARERFRLAPAEERAALIAFLQSL